MVGHNKALHRTAIPQRSVAADELGRWETLLVAHVESSPPMALDWSECVCFRSVLDYGQHTNTESVP
jgi:hypothetical protein